MSLKVLNHPLAAHYLGKLRDKDTSPQAFRQYCRLVTQLLVFEGTRSISTRSVTINTPLEPFEGEALSEGIVGVAILRAGIGMVDPLVEIVPDVSIGYVGMERDEATAEAHSYYCKLPNFENKHVFVLDPMLATGGSSEGTLSLLYEKGAASISFLCIVAAPEGVERLEQTFPKLNIVAAALDRELDENKYIRPGLGDFGDRLYGTFH